jgi:hypothetical protein
MYPYARNPWKPPPPWHMPEGKTVESESLPPQGGDRLRTYMRQVWATPHLPESGDALPAKAQAAVAAGNERLKERYLKWLTFNDWRTWTDAAGRKVEALLVQEFGGQVVLRTRAGAELTVAEDRLSAADREFLANRSAPEAPDNAPSWRQFLFQEAARAVLEFHQKHRMFPPRALTADGGNPRVSWRVLLLPQLGYGELFSLFHFDEPWDSPHNRELLPYMPDCFRVDPAAAREHKTTIAAVESPASALRNDRPVTLEDVSDGARHTALFVEAAPTRALPWTQPIDLQLFELASPPDVLAVREGFILAALLNGAVAAVPATVPRDDWRHAIEIGDHRVIESFRPAGIMQNATPRKEAAK